MRIHHLAFRTSDVPRLERFYVEILGLTVVRRDGERSVWLDAAGTIVMLERRSDDEPSIDGRSLDLACFAIEPGDRDVVLRRLEAAGIGLEGHTSYSMYFRDPDGRRVGVSSYPEPLGEGTAPRGE